MNQVEANELQGEIDQFGYACKLLAQDRDLEAYLSHSLNWAFAGPARLASLKSLTKNLYGELDDVIFHVSPVNDPKIKAIIQANTLRIELVKKIFLLETITTEQLRKELANGRVDTTGPYPTTAVLLHALLPFRVILPSPVKSSGKAQAILAMASSSTGQRRLGDILGNDVPVIPYINPIFPLVRLCLSALEGKDIDKTIGMILSNRGILAFGATVQTAYENLFMILDRAEIQVELGFYKAGQCVAQTACRRRCSVRLERDFGGKLIL